MSSPRHLCYARHHFPAEVTSHAVWLYFRFPLSLRMVEEMLAARGTLVSHETVRQWALKLGQSFANQIRRRLPAPGDKWHLDEVVISIAGRKHWLWRAVDQHGVVLDILVQSRRNAKAAKRLLRKLLKKQGIAPRDDHRQAGQLRRREESIDAQRGASAASRLEQSSREQSSADPTTRTHHEALQISRAGATISLGA
jgi:putative transposase